MTTISKAAAAKVAANRLSQIYKVAPSSYGYSETVPGTNMRRQHDCGSYRSAVAARAERRREIVEALAYGDE
jgi:hypothetical protein